MIELSFRGFYKNSVLFAEGGNIFSDRRINKSEVVPTIQRIEQLTGLSLLNSTLGSTGKSETSGDIDIVINDTKLSKDALIKDLVSKGVDSKDLKKTGIEVAYRAPIINNKGEETGDYIQVDLMFHDDPEYLKFYYDNNEKLPYKGAHRNIILASIAKTKGYSLSMKGLADRKTKNIVTKDPEELAKRVLGKDATKKDLFNLSSIMNYLKKHHTPEEVEAMVKEGEATIGLRVL